MGLSGIGKSTVSKLCKDIDERVWVTGTDFHHSARTTEA